MPVEGIFRLLVFAVPYLASGWDVLWSAIRNIFHGQVFDEKFLMTVATLGAFGIGEYPEAAAVMIFYQFGELMQSLAVGKSRKSVSALMDICPDTAVVLRDGEENEVFPEEVEPGDTLIVRAGEKIPVDGEILSGETTVNTAALTGESLPAEKKPGDKLISGCINLTGKVTMRAESRFEESTVSKILELVENSSEKKARIEGFITRFARYYTPCVTGGAVLLAVIAPVFFHGVWSEWIKRALIFLVVSCPCALVVSVPMSFFGGIGRASKNGILVKGANYLEMLTKIDTVIFDKTGTLTEGIFAVEAVHPSSVTEAELLDIAAAAECYSTHPVGESIVAAHHGHIDRSRIGDVTETPGLGVSAVIDSVRYYVGSAALMEKAGAPFEECHLSGTVIHVSRGNHYLGHIVINDKIKENAARAVAGLKNCGIEKTVILTGDKAETAAAVCSKTGADEYFAGLMPEDKVRQLEKILSEGHRAAFVGDGINDAPALMRSDVGIAMGAMGSDAAIESADTVLMDDDPLKIPLAVEIAKKTMKIVKQNVVFALAVKAVVLALGALGLANMWIAVFGDVGVTVLAVLNSLRAGSDL